MECNSNKVFKTEFSIYFNEDTPYGGYSFDNDYNGFNDVIDEDTFMNIIDIGMGKVLDKIEDSEPADVIPVEYIEEWLNIHCDDEDIRYWFNLLIQDYHEWFNNNLNRRKEEDIKLRDGEKESTQ